MGRLERKLDDDAILRARLKLGRDEPTIKRRKKPPRAGWTYRAARRNAVRAEGKLNEWRNHTKVTRVIPYQIKPPRVRIVSGMRMLIQRAQPKIYRVPVLSRRQRRVREVSRGMWTALTRWIGA